MFAQSLSLVRSKIGEIVFVFALTLALALAAQVRISLFFSPVPLTLQTFVVYLAISFLGKKAFLPLLFYLIAGICGLPFFAAASFGLVYLAGPTGGYLVGFLLAALLTPFLFSRAKTFFAKLASFSFAALIIYSLGIAWLVFFYNLSLAAAFLAGLYPFLAGEFLKISFAALLTKKL